MPDGFGDGFPLHMLNEGRPKPAYPSHAEWMMAEHLRFEHDYSMTTIAARTGIPYKEIRERFDAKT